MAQALPSKSRNCTHASLQARGSLSLPVLADHNPSGTIRKSKNGKRRAVVLTAIQILLIVHIVIWALSRHYGWFGGKTFTPIEPSESMQFSKEGIINVGLIFFALALLSTLILGRWFCGWGCHVVMLQDFCGWVMKKCGIRPKVFRSRLLMYVPLILAVYMFIMPMVWRWGMIPLDAWIGASLGEQNWLVQSIRGAANWTGFPLPAPNVAPWQPKAHLTTSDFWETFPTAYVAVPFLFICGFATVYFLGAKGFCTYGCPYGGFFAPLDKFAVGKIRVTDACEHCGHCTAVCTSNVRVHEEVREYGMVVDPGCMKCLDCVSVCPNDALYFGFGPPAVMKGAAKNKTPKRVFDLTWPEEIGMAIVFLLTFLAVRPPAPMLMAAGTASVVTYVVWKLWRMVRDASVNLHRFQLKLKGKMRPAGWGFAAAAALVLALAADCGIVKVFFLLADSADARVTIPRQVVYSGNPMRMDDDMTAQADKALRWYGLASSVSEGGISILPVNQSLIDIRKAWLLSAKLDFPAAETLLRRMLERDGPNDVICQSIMLVLHGQMRVEEAILFAEQYIADLPGLTSTLDLYLGLIADLERNERALDLLTKRYAQFPDEAPTAQALSVVLMRAGKPDQRIALWRERMTRNPDDLYTMRSLAMALFEGGSPGESAAITQRTLQIDPKNPSAYFYLSMALAQDNRMDEAIEAARTGRQLAPDSVDLNGLLGSLLIQSGKQDEGNTFMQRAMELDRQRSGAPAGAPSSGHSH